MHGLNAPEGGDGEQPRPGAMPAGWSRAARQVTVAGRVQGVSFRWSLRRFAGRHGVVGWVQNLPDGRLLAWLEGPPDAVESVAAWVETGGPPGAEVSEVDSEEVTPAGHHRFEIRR